MQSYTVSVSVPEARLCENVLYTNSRMCIGRQSRANCQLELSREPGWTTGPKPAWSGEGEKRYKDRYKATRVVTAIPAHGSTGGDLERRQAGGSERRCRTGQLDDVTSKHKLLQL